MKFVIKGNADRIKNNLQEFIDEAEKQWETETQEALKKLRKMRMLPISTNMEFPPLSLAQTKQDDNTIYLFTNIGGDTSTITGRIMNMIYKPAKKKMVTNLKAFLESRGLQVEVSIEKMGENNGSK